MIRIVAGSHDFTGSLGALDALGTAVTGTLVAQVPVLSFCVAFGLSMDYEVFLNSRIREIWLSTAQRTRHDNDGGIARGLAGTDASSRPRHY
jgi:RND superfamily putative drug exporter